MDIYIFFYLLWIIASAVTTVLLCVTMPQNSLWASLTIGMIGGWCFAFFFAALYFISKSVKEHSGKKAEE